MHSKMADRLFFFPDPLAAGRGNKVGAQGRLPLSTFSFDSGRSPISGYRPKYTRGSLIVPATPDYHGVFDNCIGWDNLPI